MPIKSLQPQVNEGTDVNEILKVQISAQAEKEHNDYLFPNIHSYAHFSPRYLLPLITSKWQAIASSLPPPALTDGGLHME